MIKLQDRGKTITEMTIGVFLFVIDAKCVFLPPRQTQ